MKIFILASLLIGGTNLFAGTIRFDWDKPEVTQTQDHQICRVFKSFTLFEFNAPDQKGAVFKVRIRREVKSAADECTLKPGEKLVEFASGSLQGVLGSKLILIEDGMLGDESTLVIVEALNGKTLFSALHDDSSPVKLEKVNGRTALTYFAFLNEPPAKCDIQKDKSGDCLREVLRFNHVPKTDDIKGSDCPSGADSVALFLEARVKDIQNPKPEFTGKSVRCTWRQ